MNKEYIKKWLQFFLSWLLVISLIGIIFYSVNERYSIIDIESNHKEVKVIRPGDKEYMPGTEKPIYPPGKVTIEDNK